MDKLIEVLIMIGVIIIAYLTGLHGTWYAIILFLIILFLVYQMGSFFDALLSVFTNLSPNGKDFLFLLFPVAGVVIGLIVRYTYGEGNLGVLSKIFLPS